MLVAPAPGGIPVFPGAAWASEKPEDGICEGFFRRMSSEIDNAAVAAATSSVAVGPPDVLDVLDVLDVMLRMKKEEFDEKYCRIDSKQDLANR